MVDATSGAYSPLYEVMQQAFSVCYFSPIEYSLFWTWSNAPEWMEMLPGVFHLCELSTELHRKVICSFIQSEMQQPSGLFHSSSYAAIRSKAYVWLQICWIDIKPEMIVLRLMLLFIIPSGHELKTSEIDSPIIAFYYYCSLKPALYWLKFELIYQRISEIAVCCCGPMAVMCEWLRWVEIPMASQTQMSSKIAHVSPAEHVKKPKRKEPCMFNSTHFRAGIHIVAFLNPEGYFWFRNSDLANQPFSLPDV